MFTSFVRRRADRPGDFIEGKSVEAASAGGQRPFELVRPPSLPWALRGGNPCVGLVSCGLVRVCVRDVVQGIPLSERAISFRSPVCSFAHSFIGRSPTTLWLAIRRFRSIRPRALTAVDDQVLARRACRRFLFLTQKAFAFIRSGRIGSAAWSRGRHRETSRASRMYLSSRLSRLEPSSGPEGPRS